MNADRLLEFYKQISEAPDAIKRLRRLVLDLAVRGKLVAQDAKDEPAKELLKRTSENKMRLIKSKEIRNPKKLTAISLGDYQIFHPETWCIEKLGNLTTVITKGSTPTSYGHEYTDRGVNFIKVESIVGGRISEKSVTSFVSNETHEFLARSQLHVGDLLFSIAGSIGTCALVTPETVPANTNQALAIIRGTSISFEADFLILVLRSFVSDAIKEKARGGAMNNVSLTDLQNLIVPIPPLAEQQRIVAKVDELMALCDRLEETRKTREETRDKLTAASLARLTAPDTTPEDFPAHARFALDALPALTSRPDQIKTLRQTILNLAVQGKLVEQDPADEPASVLLKRITAEKAGRLKGTRGSNTNASETAPPRNQTLSLPKGWELQPLGNIIKLWNGYAFKSADFKDSGVPVIRIGDLVDGEVSLSSAKCVPQEVAESVSSEVWIPEGALLLAMSGATTGKTAFNRTGHKLLLNQRVGRIETFSTNILFVRIFFETVIARNLSISMGSAIPNLSSKQINETAFPLPPLAEQNRIVAKVDALMALCDRLEATLTTANTTRTRLLEALLHEALEPATREEVAA